VIKKEHTTTAATTAPTTTIFIFPDITPSPVSPKGISMKKLEITGARLFNTRMPFLSFNQFQSTEWILNIHINIVKPFIDKKIVLLF